MNAALVWIVSLFVVLAIWGGWFFWQRAAVLRREALMQLGIGIGNVIMGLGVARVIVSGRLVYGWKFISGPLREAVGQSMAGRISGWSVEPDEAGMQDAFGKVGQLDFPQAIADCGVDMDAFAPVVEILAGR